MYGMLRIWGLRWWDARFKRMSKVWDISPQMANIEHTDLISPGHWKCRVVGVEGTCAIG
jgi:hypothetical protein